MEQLYRKIKASEVPDGIHLGVCNEQNCFVYITDGEVEKIKFSNNSQYTKSFRDMAKLEVYVLEPLAVIEDKEWEDKIGKIVFENHCHVDESPDVYWSERGLEKILTAYSARVEDLKRENDDLRKENERISPYTVKGMAYERVCSHLGIKDDILGYVDVIKDRLSELEKFVKNVAGKHPDGNPSDIINQAKQLLNK